jgi:zona occludens toxin
MFFFHEGLPGSGKSYEAVVKHLIPALASSRPVDAYIEGLDHEKLAELAGITQEQCEELLAVLSREDVENIWSITRDNALIIIDEMQNFWPSNKSKLGPDITQFITEHRHRGQDILGIGQDLRDVHALWRRRCAQKVVFSKLDGLGREDNYSYRLLKATTPDKFQVITKGAGKYDSKYFGSYSSHVSTETNTGNYKDKRAVIWNSWLFRFGLPGMLLVVAFSVYTIAHFFGGNSSLIKTPQKPPATKSVTEMRQTIESDFAAARAVPAPVLKKEPPKDYLQEISSNWRVRLGGIISMSGRFDGFIDWYDSALRHQERLTFAQITSMGYTIDYELDIVTIRRGDFTLVATSWPMEIFGKIPGQQLKEISQLP